jgi:hypothetical protein
MERHPDGDLSTEFVLTDAVAGEVGTSSHLSGNPTYRELKDEKVRAEGSDWRNVQRRYPNLKLLILTLPLIVFLIWSVGAYVTFSRVATREVKTSGLVKAHDPANHDRWEFQYEVNGESFYGWHYPGACPPEFAKSGNLFGFSMTPETRLKQTYVASAN